LSEFIFMLTWNDRTVPDALDVYRSVQDVGLTYVGFKDVGVTPSSMRDLVSAIRDGGHRVMLEVVSESMEDELHSAEAAIGLGVDYLLGGTHAHEVSGMIAGSGVSYFPFPGRVTGHPSRLEGTIDDIAESAQTLAAMPDVDGLDLLAYRHTGDVGPLIGRVVEAVSVPVVVAGSIETPEQIEMLSRRDVWGFTVGTAVFERRFQPGSTSVVDQVEAILRLAMSKQR
jgi:hypothetical protein